MNKEQTKPKTYLFLISISPVQSFIAEARKTHDLYAGSRILSDLTQIGMTKFTKNGGVPIFPNSNNESKPNRFLGKIEKDSASLSQVGKDIEEEIRDKFEELGENAIKNSGLKEEKASKVRELFDKQINNHLEISWVFQEIENNDYQTAYSSIEAHLEAVKNTKGFEQFAETGRKCSIDGKNNALFFGRKKPSLSLQAQRTNSVTVSSYALKEKEGLSAVSFLKRFYENEQYKQDAFPSTAQIALMYAESQLNKEVKEYFEDFKKVFRSGEDTTYIVLKYNLDISIRPEDFESEDWIAEPNHFDYQLLYQENFDNQEMNTKQRKIAQFLFNKIQPHFKDKYYALLAFDGDKMGDMLSGNLLKDKENTDLEKYQEKISGLLSSYADAAKKILQKEKYNGAAVYAGGDDFLGFINLHNLSSVLTLLRKTFEEDVNQNLKKDYPLTEDFTFSAGIAIAHYKTPLNIVLQTAKEMEHKAKEEGERNAFAIAVLKHSGDSHDTVFKWGENFNNLKYIYEIVKSLETDFSSKWIQNLDVEFALFAKKELNFKLEEEHQPLVEQEMKRLINRSCNLAGEQKKKTVEQLYQIAQKLLAGKNEYNFRTFIQMLHIARFIRKELKN